VHAAAHPLPALLQAEDAASVRWRPSCARLARPPARARPSPTHITHSHAPQPPNNRRRGAAAWTELEHLDARGKAKNTLKVSEDVLGELKKKCKSLDTAMGADPNDETNRAGLAGVTKAKKK
jgi:hypothetical protein